MAKVLNFNKLKKQYMTVTLPDENNTTILVGTPTKAVMDDLLGLQHSLSAENMGDDAINELYEICAKIMSRNKTGVRIEKSDLEEIFDFEDVIFFIREYSDFIGEVSNAKN